MADVAGMFGRDLEFPLKLGPELFLGGCNAQVKFKDGDPENYRHGLVSTKEIGVLARRGGRKGGEKSYVQPEPEWKVNDDS